MKMLVWGGLVMSVVFLFAGLVVTCKAFCDMVCCPFFCCSRPFCWAWSGFQLGLAAFRRLLDQKDNPSQ